MQTSRAFSVALLSLAFHTGCAGGAANCDLTLPSGVPHSCPNFDLQPGSSQGACRSGLGITSFCDPSLTCIDGACIPCGFSGGPCCALPDGEHCSGTACDQSENLTWPTCVGGCQVGDPCCDNNFCGGGAVCNQDTDTCEAPQTSMCVPGNEQFTVILIDQDGCAQTPSTIASDNQADAQACAQAFLTEHDPDGTLQLAPLDATVICHDFCEVSTSGNASVGASRCALTPEALATCEQAQCTNCTIEDNTSCP